MAWTELRQRGGDTSSLKRLLHDTKENIEEICEMIEEMDGDESYGERGMEYRKRGMGMRRGYRIVEDDGNDWGERRGMRGGRY